MANKIMWKMEQRYVGSVETTRKAFGHWHADKNADLMSFEQANRALKGLLDFLVPDEGSDFEYRVVSVALPDTEDEITIEKCAMLPQFWFVGTSKAGNFCGVDDYGNAVEIGWYALSEMLDDKYRRQHYV